MATRIDQAQRKLTQRLRGSSDSPSLETRILVQHVTGKPAAWVLAHPEETLTAEMEQEFERLARRLVDGEPLPYLTGKQEFYGLDFAVNPDVLIPRPETELLVEFALQWLEAHPDRRHAVDVGTGSGCIAVTLAVKAPALQVTAVDISAEALDVARSNADHHRVTNRVRFLQVDLLEGIPGPFDLIAANLPYIPSDTLETLDVSRHEPKLALDGGPDGMDQIRTLLKQAPEKMATGGLVLLEIEAGQGEAALSLAKQAFPLGETRVLKDLAGRDRLVEIMM
jgi:release factor glutamine methyltransferase